MAKKGGQPKIGRTKSASPGRTQPKSFGAHVKRVASQPKLKRR
jgi:hypothetical protein